MEFQKLELRNNLRMFIILLTFAGFYNTANATDYNVDKGSSTVRWDAKKVTGKHNGTIAVANGSFAVSKGGITGGTVVIDMKTIVDVDLTDAGYNAKLTGHLKSDDFFAVDKFPESKLVINKVTTVSSSEYKFVADLTIKGVTNPVEFNAKVTLNGEKLTAEGIMTINRAKFGVKYGSSSFFENLGDKVIYDDFTLTFNIVASKK